MQFIRVSLISIFFLLISLSNYAEEGLVVTSQFSASEPICPYRVHCVPGTNFFSLTDANICGCCYCHGGAVGCAGGFKGRIICADTTIADKCRCQMIIKP